MAAKPIRLDVLRAKQRPPDVVFTVEFWRLHDGKWWHEPYSVASCIGKLEPSVLRMLGHAIFDDGRTLWCESGSPIPPKRKAVKVRRRHR